MNITKKYLRPFLIGLLLIFSLTGCEFDRDADLGNPDETSTAESWGKEKPLRKAEDIDADSSFLIDWSFKYDYDRLSEDEKVWYRDIETILGAMEKEVYLSAVDDGRLPDDESVSKIFQYVVNDHPELFYVEGYSCIKYTRGDKLNNISFSGDYSCEPDEAKVISQEIINSSKQIVESCKGLSDDYEKIKFIYEYIVFNTDYDENAPHNQDIYSVLVLGKSVCQGYSKAFQYLALESGIDATICLGTVEDGQGHAWNLVNSNGNYYYVDPTWADPSYDLSEYEDADGRSLPEINYYYLNVTYDEISKTHDFDYSVTLPLCVADMDNYYVREGLYFTEFDKEGLREVFGRAFENEDFYITIKCSDRLIYDEMLNRLVEKSEVFDFIPEKNITVTYSTDEDKLTLLFWMTK